MRDSDHPPIKGGQLGVKLFINLKLAVNKDVISPSVHFRANMFTQPTLKGYIIMS